MMSGISSGTSSVPPGDVVHHDLIFFVDIVVAWLGRAVGADARRYGDVGETGCCWKWSSNG